MSSVTGQLALFRYYETAIELTPFRSPASSPAARITKPGQIFTVVKHGWPVIVKKVQLLNSRPQATAFQGTNVDAGSPRVYRAMFSRRWWWTCEGCIPLRFAVTRIEPSLLAMLRDAWH